jgi:hypothetical protein
MAMTDVMTPSATTVAGNVIVGARLVVQQPGNAVTRMPDGTAAAAGMD